MTRGYASNARRPGELSLSEVADKLGVHSVTVRRWAREAISGNTDSKLQPGEARRDLIGRYWIDGAAVDRLPDRLRIDDYI